MPQIDFSSPVFYKPAARAFALFRVRATIYSPKFHACILLFLKHGRFLVDIAVVTIEIHISHSIIIYKHVNLYYDHTIIIIVIYSKFSRKVWFEFLKISRILFVSLLLAVCYTDTIKFPYSITEHLCFIDFVVLMPSLESKRMQTT
jgi:hypothetical protein